uniref:FAD-binding oxidoreductase n=1 Tax=Halomonas sp. TaxID=1486246 RepID=UPI002610F78D|nr:FAD-binding oxidoreductase [Halomonas sp.]
MSDHDELVADLQRMLGNSGVLWQPADMERYRVDWAGSQGALPLAVARPASVEEVAEVVGYCHRHDIPIVPQGGGSGLVEGALPDSVQPELVISLERLNRIREIDPIGYTISVDAGCVLQNVKDAAAAEGCFFPLSLGAQGSCQIGGNISTNAGGLNVLRYGMMRQQVLGLEVVLADGRIWHGMKALHKNNTGYDLKQLFIGAEGTLGIVTGAVLKLSPAPEVTRSAMLACSDVSAVMRLYTLARRCCCDLLSAFELIPRACIDLALEADASLPDPMDIRHPVYVLLEVSASGPANLDDMLEALFERGLEQGLLLDGVLASSDTQASQLWRIREAMLEGQQRRGEHLRSDISVPISQLSDFHDQAEAMVRKFAPDASVIAYGHVGDGNLHFNVLPPPDLPGDETALLLHTLEEQLFDIVDAFDGSISAEHGIGRLKQARFLESLSAPELDIMRGIKRLLDPRGQLGAGRILPRTPL